MPPTRTRNAMNASRSSVREGVLFRYWFQTWTATSCGEDLVESADEGLEDVVVVDWEGTGLGVVGAGVLDF